jgi:hypothetical protein
MRKIHQRYIRRSKMTEELQESSISKLEEEQKQSSRNIIPQCEIFSNEVLTSLTKDHENNLNQSLSTLKNSFR